MEVFEQIINFLSFTPLMVKEDDIMEFTTSYHSTYILVTNLIMLLVMTPSLLIGIWNYQIYKMPRTSYNPPTKATVIFLMIALGCPILVILYVLSYINAILTFLLIGRVLLDMCFWDYFIDHWNYFFSVKEKKIAIEAKNRLNDDLVMLKKSKEEIALEQYRNSLIN